MNNQIVLNDEIMAHLEKALDKVRAQFTEAATRIEAIKPGEKIPATGLAKDLGKLQTPEVDGAQVYPTLKILLDDYPGVDIRRGAHGGIYRLKPGEVAGQKKNVPSKPNVVSVDKIEGNE